MSVLTLSDLVHPAVDEEKSTFLGSQNTRPKTIEMTEKLAAEDDGVVRRDRSRALRARSPLLLHRRFTSPKMAGDGRIAPSPSSLNILRF